MIARGRLHFFQLSIVWLASLDVCYAQSANSAQQVYSIRALEVVDDDGDAISINGEVKVSLRTLLGEPLVGCGLKWSVNQVLRVEGMPVADVPPDVRNSIKMHSVKLQFPTNNTNQLAEIICDAGALKPEGSGKYSFNVPGSPNWNKTFRVKGSRDEYHNEQQAKSIAKSLFENGFNRLAVIRIDSAEINLRSVKDWNDASVKSEKSAATRTADEQLFDRIANGHAKKRAAATHGTASWDEIWKQERERVSAIATAKKVRDDCNNDLFTSWDARNNKCTKLVVATEPKASFDREYRSGGAGVHVFDFAATPAVGARVVADWDMKQIPDRFVVFFNEAGIEKQVFDSGMVSASKSVRLPAFFGDSLRVVMTGGREGTAWSFTLSL